MKTKTTIKATTTDRRRMPREEQKIRTIPPPEKCCICWTGGKDCNLALLKCWRDPSLEVTDLVVFRPDDKTDFEAHPLALMKAQADSLGLTLRITTFPSHLSYRDAYVQAITELRDVHGIQVVATGDMDLVDIENSRDNYIKECCKMAGGGIRCYLPLWNADREECLRTLIVENKCHIVFSCVKSPWFDASWCGKIMDEEAICKMIIISRDGLQIAESERSEWGLKDPRRTNLDLGGENGEYHTMVLDGPLYQYEIAIQAISCDAETGNRSEGGGKSKSILLNSVISGPAENGEERWWTYTGQTRWSLGSFEVHAGTAENKKITIMR